MQMRRSKADQTVEGMCILLSHIYKGTVFLHRCVTNYGFRKLVRYNLTTEFVIWYDRDAVKSKGLSVKGCTLKKIQ